MRISSAFAGAALAALITVGLAVAAHGDALYPKTGSLFSIDDDGATGTGDAAPKAAPLTILLMGDSYTAGNGARDEAGERSYYGPAKCMRSRDTWGEQYADALGSQGYAVTLLNRACSAATTHNMLNNRYLKRTDSLVYPEPETQGAIRSQEFYAGWAASQAACVASPNSDEFIVPSVTRGSFANGERTVTVNCARWLRPQVDALNPDVDLVFFTAGGNDAKFPDIMRQCLVLGSAPGCEAALDKAETYLNEDFTDDLTRVLDEMHSRTDGNAKVVYLGYPRLDANRDLVLTSIENGKVVQLPIAAKLDRLIEQGAVAQGLAVDRANAKYGDGFVTYLDGLPELFAGHEPDARPGFSNPDRWIAEAFETNVKDEWYHFRPEGQRAIAGYVASFGTFGIEGGEPSRDLAVVTDGSARALAAVARSATMEALKGARVSIVEQRVDNQGAGLEQRVVARDLDAAATREWARGSRAGAGAWSAVAGVDLTARWNATQQVIFVGDASVGTGHLGSVWQGDEQGLFVDPHVTVIDTGATALAGGADYTWAGDDPRAAVEQAFTGLADVPHAWAGGRYATAASGRVTLDASGSYGADQLSYAWDLDRDGRFEFQASDARAQVEARLVSPGWVSLKVTMPGGAHAVSRAWVDPGTAMAGDSAAACAGEGGGASDACRPITPTSRWNDDVTSSGDHVQPSASADAEHTALLAWLADPQLFTEERQLRSLAISVRDGRAGTRASAASRRRPRELVQREQGLQVLLDAGSRELVAV